jgi:hypothetical protein
MIAYEILVQTIADWRAGVRPSAPSVPPPPRGGAPEPVEEVESGVVNLDDGQEYGEDEYATETYEDTETEE